MTNEVPLIWTSKGNLPVDSLRYENQWVDNPDVLLFHERWFLGDELVKNNLHGYVKQGLVIGAEQAQIG